MEEFMLWPQVEPRAEASLSIYKSNNGDHSSEPEHNISAVNCPALRHPDLGRQSKTFLPQQLSVLRATWPTHTPPLYTCRS
ncbi:hypothetical protein EVAR_27371_1 [Eumeta japonica]|uniref:Uncharacterized protein n=1 Tax=Eumeta variegata TaxID=151549 RepID=A0A4C1X2F7_EUMVA|nr:hypothetical protein EVAR_27371_1 [Eumeta japonica]